uniref:Uncharacterized protein n=1 Tax=Anopheles funestus TaxID=62324 RepID=A0A4Y0BFR2_ANOFN
MLKCTEVLLIITIFLIKWQYSHGEVVANEGDLKNKTRPFTIRVTRLVCINMPYEETVVKECRAILRRNQRSLICVTIDVPKVYNYIMLQFRLYYKFTTFQPLLIDGQYEVCSYMRGFNSNPLDNYMYEVLKDLLPNTVYPCPHGNKTYAERSEFKDEYAPKSVPAAMLRCTEVLLIITIFLIKWQYSHGEVVANEADLKNKTRPFTIRVTRLICKDTPYEETVVKECRAILRRNQRSLICVTIDLPKVYNYITLQFRLHYKFTTYKPLLIDGQREVCSYLNGSNTNPLENFIFAIVKQKLPHIDYSCRIGETMLRCTEVLLIITICAIKFHCSQGQIFVTYEKQKNETRPFTLHVTRVRCIEMPYKELVVHECRAMLRRHQKTLICVSIFTPKVYNYILLQFRLHYKFTTYQPFLIDGEVEVCSYLQRPKIDPLFNYMHGMLKDLLPSIVHPCPHGNKTYTERTVLKEEYAPKSIPAGDYRMDIRFANRSNVTLIWIQTFFSARRKGVLGSMLEW